MKPAFAPVEPAGKGALPVSLSLNPRLSDWICVRPDGTVDVLTGKVELGQGILTALAQIAADALELDVARVRVGHASTRRHADESVTSGSLSVQHSGMAIRMACAFLRAQAMRRVAHLAGVEVAEVSMRDGQFYAAGKAWGGYAQLAADLDMDATVAPPPEEVPPPARRYVGESLPPFGLSEKVRGAYTYIHDLVFDGMVHGRVLRPPGPLARLRDFVPGELAQADGVLDVVRDGDLVGVLAESERVADRVIAALGDRATWDEADALPDPDPDALQRWLRSAATAEPVTLAKAPAQAPGKAVRRYEADYLKPFLKHASIGPSCAYARTGEDGALEVWTHSQGIYNLQADLAVAFGLQQELVVVHHVPGAGCYGHNGADDAAYDAAWLSRRVPGRVVRLQWSRADELSWSPQSPPMSVRVEADVDERGRVVDWRHTIWSPGHSLRPGRAATPTLLGSWYAERAFPRIDAVNGPQSAGGGADRNIEPIYDFGCSALVCHRLVDVPVRTSAMRALGALANVFAVESTIDDIALDHGYDPIDYRLQCLGDARAATVLRRVAAMSGWHERRPAPGNESGRGMGVGLARYKGKGAYCAVVAEVEVSHEIRVDRLYIAADVGEIINPEGVRQQLEGGAIQAVSWTLYESAAYTRRGMVVGGWEQYPIARFSQVPPVEISLVEDGDAPAVGAGEPSVGPTVAAIANAVMNALGVRVRRLPITPDAVMAAMQD